MAQCCEPQAESELGTSAIYTSKSGREMWWGGSTFKTQRDGEMQL